MDQESRKRKILTIGTHSGTFHCDEVLAVFMLKQLPEFEDATIVRTRDETILKDLNIIVDVGGEYNPENGRFDHHQKSFNGTLNERETMKLSSAGLIYKHYGRQIIANRLKCDDKTTELIFRHIYKEFIEGVDGVDNGVPQYPPDLQPKYLDHTSLAHRISRLNPPWTEKNPDYDARFRSAMEVAGKELLERIDHTFHTFLPAFSIVDQAVKNRQQPEILTLDQFCPWKSHLEALEVESNLGDTIKFIIYPDESGRWRIQGVPQHPGSFICRIFLPKPWRGLRDAELSKEADIEGCVFVHASGFIGGHLTKEGALAMAQKALHFPSDAQ